MTIVKSKDEALYAEIDMDSAVWKVCRQVVDDMAPTITEFDRASCATQQYLLGLASKFPIPA